jgi:Sulfotransferase family
MLLSYDPAFLFIHVDKAAGSSIRTTLEAHSRPRRNNRLRRRLVWLGPLNRLGGLYRQMEFPLHATAAMVKRCLPPQLYFRLFKFAFVRNPYDRLVSRYSFFLNQPDHPRHKFVARMKGFEEYLAWEMKPGKLFQHSYVTDRRGQWLVDFIGYYERLQEDFANVSSRLGVRMELPRANASRHRDYRTYYTPATRERVAEYFQRDLELFGYDFDGLIAPPVQPRPMCLARSASRE